MAEGVGATFGCRCKTLGHSKDHARGAERQEAVARRNDTEAYCRCSIVAATATNPAIIAVPPTPPKPPGVLSLRLRRTVRLCLPLPPRFRLRPPRLQSNSPVTERHGFGFR